MLNHFLRLAFLLFGVAVASAQQGVDYLCAGELTIEHSTGPTSPIDFSNFTFFGSVENSAGRVELLNKDSQAIRYYLVIFDLLDSAGKYILSVPVFNVDDDQNVPFNVAFKPWVLANWPGGYFDPIGPKAKAKKTFQIPFTVLTCPTAVRISMVQLRYKDGSEFRASISTVRTPSIVTEATVVDAEGYRRWTAVTTLGIIRVDSMGRGHAEAPNGQSAEFSPWFEREISAWKFFPSSVDGATTAGEIPFLLVVGDLRNVKGQLDLIKEKGQLGAILVLQAIPPGSSFGNAWALSAGGQVVIARKKG
jgi:hypothetical protein